MKKIKWLSGIAFVSIPLTGYAGNFTYLMNSDEIMGYVISELRSGGKESINREKIIVKNIDVNGDKKLDYLILYPPLSCGSQGCYASIFLNTDNGYCVTLNGEARSESDTHYPNIKCEASMF